MGEQFLDEFNKAIKRLKLYPEISEKTTNELRRCILNRFPYGIIYGIDGDIIVIVAVAHLHREPDYWIYR